MKSIIKSAGAAAALALVAGCATTESAPPQAQAPVGATASRGLAAQASAFESFVRHARTVDGDFSGPAEVAQALQAGASHDPKELEAGMVAYAAMAALQEPKFVAAVRAQNRGDFARRLAANPNIALTLPGGEAAGARASGALYAQGAALTGVGQRVKKASYTVQHQAWSKANAGGRPRLERVKRISQAGYQPAREDTGKLFTSLADGGKRGGRASPLVARGVALAALSAIGQEGQGRSLMSDPKTSACLRIAKLNLYQCLASAGPHYEDIYCLGAHAMIEPGQCVVDATKPAKASPIQKASYRR